MKKLTWTIVAVAVTALFWILLLRQIFRADSTPPINEMASDHGEAVDPANGTPRQIEALSLDLGDGVMLDLVLIRPGSFMMGSDTSGEADEKPSHEVTITRPFYLGKFEVTQQQWKAVMGTDPSAFKGARRPVETVSWDDCEEFIGKLNEKFAGKSFRLPTEAEWEYACRAGSATSYYFGDEAQGLADHAWFAGNSGETHAVGEKLPNAWGLYDMYGNVWERCQSLYRPYPYSDDGREDLGQRGPRVVRGGSWHSGAEFCRSTERLSGRPTPRYDNFGCRVAMAVPE